MKENRIDSIEKNQEYGKNQAIGIKSTDKKFVMLAIIIVGIILIGIYFLWDEDPVHANDGQYIYEFIYYESENGTIRTIQLTDYYYKGCVEYSGLSQAIEDMHKDGFRKYVQSYDLRNHHVAIIFEKQRSE